MMWMASGFLFVRGKSFIHRMDARVRLLFALSLFSVSLVSRSIIELSSMILLIACLAALAGILRRFGKSMIFTAVIAVVAFVVNLIFPPRDFSLAVVFGLRLFAVIASTSIFFLTSTPDELEQVMKWLRLPPDFVMVFVIAVRFVPVLLLDAIQIMDAQRSRGLEFDKGNLIQRFRNAIPVLVPLIAVALNRSIDLAEAMDSRAYGARKKPTSLYTLTLRSSDYLALAVSILGAAFGLYVALFVHLL
ncbi:MAG: energy-coupling factor transporter transmembrane protein EcfT [Nitrososphaerota archaeon]|nr:energy-coupling factor transporter transmembrane protein EcfT [Nitrososphaerota archaeon]